MTVLVNVQRMGRGKKTVQSLPLELSGAPRMVEELITLCTESCAARPC